MRAAALAIGVFLIAVGVHAVATTHDVFQVSVLGPLFVGGMVLKLYDMMHVDHTR